MPVHKICAKRNHTTRFTTYLGGVLERSEGLQLHAVHTKRCELFPLSYDMLKPTHISAALSAEPNSSSTLSDFWTRFSLRTLNRARPAGVSKRTNMLDTERNFKGQNPPIAVKDSDGEGK